MTSAPEQTEAQVVEVVDGDTIEVEVGGQVHTVRYIGIDAPETKHLSEPVEWMGPEETDANRELVEGKTVYLEKDVSETDQYGRWLRYVFLADGRFVNARLVEMGYAQSSTYPADVNYKDVLREKQREAREAERGLWGPTPTPPPWEARVAVEPECCQFDAPGDDSRNKEEEYVCFVNAGSSAVDVEGWEVRDEQGWSYTFPDVTLSAGTRLRVVTGCGRDTDDVLYWCKDGAAVWNNGGDTVFLHDDAGAVVTQYSY
jgi:micrococcal nuclease